MLIPSIAAAIGTILVLLIYHRSSAKLAAKQAQWMVGKIVTDATVARCVETAETGEYWSNIEYTARDGQRYQITGDFALQPADVGKNVRVAYDPKMPSEARLIEEPEETGPFSAAFVLIFSYAAFFIVAMTIQAFLGAR